MTDAPRRFEPPTPEMLALQAAVNADLAGIAKVNLFIRNDPDHPRYCVLVQDGPRRWTVVSDQPLDASDKDHIVEDARELVQRPRPMSSRYRLATEEDFNRNARERDTEWG